MHTELQHRYPVPCGYPLEEQATEVEAANTVHGHLETKHLLQKLHTLAYNMEQRLFMCMTWILGFNEYKDSWESYDSVLGNM